MSDLSERTLGPELFGLEKERREQLSAGCYSIPLFTLFLSGQLAMSGMQYCAPGPYWVPTHMLNESRAMAGQPGAIPVCVFLRYAEAEQWALEYVDAFCGGRASWYFKGYPNWAVWHEFHQHRINSNGCVC